MDRGGGADDTAALQAVLDKALSGEKVTLVMDGAALITGLIIHDNTTVRCINPSCGFYLAAGAGMPSRIKRLPLENVYIHGDKNVHDYIKVRGETENLSVRNAQITACRPESGFIRLLYPESRIKNLQVSCFVSDPVFLWAAEPETPEKKE